LADVSPTLSGTALFDAIANESFRTCLRRQRFWDLVRWGKASTELAGYTKNNLFPIPVNEINLNDALTNADQNRVLIIRLNIIKNQRR
jgi:hypothetical protein